MQLGNLSLLNLLLSNNADIMVQDAKGQTPLHLACIKGDLESYILIVTRSYQAKNCVDKAQKTPLDYAFEGKHLNIIEYDKKCTVMLYAHKGAAKKLKPEDFDFIMPLGRGAFG